MRETPPYSLAEIRLLLVQYLDGTLEPDRMLALDDLLVQFPDYQAEFLKLQAAQARIHESLGQQAEEAFEAANESVSMWNQIASQLVADEENAPQAVYSAEWVSAYIDGEIPRQDQEREAFEGQLAQSDEASQLLADLTLVSESVKQFGYRLEGACSVDVTQAVMEAFMADQEAVGQEQNVMQTATNIPNESQPAEVAVDPDWELLSAFTDQALSPREIIQATQLIESSDAARANLASLNRLSEQIQQVSQQMQRQAPDVWPAVHAVLQALPESEQIKPLSRDKKMHWLRPATIPIAATLLLALLSLPSLHLTSFTHPVSQAAHLSPASASKMANQTLKAEDAQPAEAQELASVPAAERHVSAMRNLAPAEASADLDTMVDGVSPQAEPDVAVSASASAPVANAAPIKPMLESTRGEIAKMANLSSPTAIPAEDATSTHSPSSETYLLDSLNRQTSDEDVSNILED